MTLLIGIIDVIKKYQKFLFLFEIIYFKFSKTCIQILNIQILFHIYVLINIQIFQILFI